MIMNNLTTGKLPFKEVAVEVFAFDDEVLMGVLTASTNGTYDKGLQDWNEIG